MFRTEEDSLNQSSVFLEPETEEILDVTLCTGETIILQPGENEVVLSAKVISF